MDLFLLVKIVVHGDRGVLGSLPFAFPLALVYEYFVVDQSKVLTPCTKHELELLKGCERAERDIGLQSIQIQFGVH